MKFFIPRAVGWLGADSSVSRRTLMGLTLLVVATLTTGFWWFNHMTPLMADDWCMILPDWSSIPPFLHTHYFEWGGRIPAHLIATAFLQFPKYIFDLGNTAAFMLLTLLPVYWATGRRILTSPATWLGAFALLWLGLRAFGEFAFWIAGAANYLWTTLFILLFLTPYVLLALGRGNPFARRPVMALVTWPFLALLAGWTNENAAPTAFLLAIGLLAYTRLAAREAIPAWAWTSLIFMLGGILLLLGAPGNSVRLHSGAFESTLNKTMLERILKFISRSHKHFILSCLPVWLAAITVLVCRARLRLNTTADAKRRLHVGLILMTGLFLNTGALIASPYVEPRALTAGIIFLIACVLLLAQDLPGNMRTALFGAFTLAMLPSLAITFGKYVTDGPVFSRQEAALAACKTSLAPVCDLPSPAAQESRYYVVSHFGKVHAEPEHWVNMCRAKLNHVPAIRGLPTAP